MNWLLLLLQKDDSMVCGAFVTNGKADSKQSCRIYDYPGQWENLSHNATQVVRDKVALNVDFRSDGSLVNDLTPFLTPSSG
jgi:hypothetical protein